MEKKTLKEHNENSHPAQRWMFEVWEQPLSKVGNASKVVAGVIAACAWGGKDSANPGYRAIAEATGQSSKTISKAVKQLEAAGLVVVEKKKSPAGVYNSYRLTFPVGTEDLLSLQGQKDLLSLQGEVAFPVGTGCFPHEEGLLYTGKAEAIKEAQSEALTEALTEEVKEKDEQPSLPLDELVKQTSSVRSDFPLEPLQPFTLISKPARDEQSQKTWTEKSHARQAQINAEVLAEFAGHQN